MYISVRSFIHPSVRVAKHAMQTQLFLLPVWYGGLKTGHFDFVSHGVGCVQELQYALDGNNVFQNQIKVLFEYEIDLFCISM